MDINMLLALALFVLCPIGALLLSLLPEQSKFADFVDHVIEANKFEQRLVQLTMREEEILGIPGKLEGYSDAEHKLWGESNLPNCPCCGQKNFLGTPFCSPECEAAERLMLLQDAEEALWPRCHNCGNIHRGNYGGGIYCGEFCEKQDTQKSILALEQQFEDYTNSEKHQWGDAV